MALEIAAQRHVIMPGKKLAVLVAEFTHHLSERPDIKFALLAFGIGIQRSRKCPLCRRHFALEPFDCFKGTLAIERLAATPICDGEQLEQLRIVVEHLFEMRHQPSLIDRIARKTAAEMVVDAALANMIEGDVDGGEVALLAGAQAATPEQFEQGGLRKFRCAAGAAIDRVDDTAELPRRIVELGHADG